MRVLPEESIDVILEGQLKIIQKKPGYRFSIDALLLAHYVRLKKAESILDLGTGSGIVGMILCRHPSCSRVVGIEIQKDLADMARRNIRLNRVDHKMKVFCGDVRAITELVPLASFDVVVFNPPYRKLLSGRISPDKQRAIARHEMEGSIRDFLSAAFYALKKNGRLYAIYHAVRLIELLCNMRCIGIEPKRLRMVHSRENMNGEFILVEGVKGARESLEVMPPLILYQDDQRLSPAVLDIFSRLASIEGAGAG
jgi:tRNA1Val (adenine37-N6)-methyltransferase